MEKHQIIFCRELSQHSVGESVCVTGVIVQKWGRKEKFGMSIMDLTGSVNVSFVGNEYNFDKGNFNIGKRIRVYATVSYDRKENKCLNKVVEVEFLEEISQLNKELDILEQESLVMLSKICNKIRGQLNKLQFIEVSTRVISRYIGEEILEPILVDYPGFGSSAYLTPSPSSQLSEFLAVTLLPRVFTSTISFTTSHRFPNGSTETPIIMAKAINLSQSEEKELIVRITNSIVNALSEKNIQIEYVKGIWNDELVKMDKKKSGSFVFGTYAANIPAIGRKWNSVVQMINRLEDDKGNILAESANEMINDKVNICSITFYPAQYLNWVSKAPKRQILNLWKVYDGGSIYG